MARNSKAKRSAPAGKKARGGTLIGMFIGLVLGVVMAAGVVWYMNRTPMPFVTKSLQPPPKTETAPANGDARQPAQPLALPGKPGDPLPEKRFQFYDILPGKADAVPGAKPADAEAKKEEPKKEARKDESKQPLFLQAGSFSKPKEADNLKASLALMGLEASVQQVMVQDKTYYRVRLGPYNRIDDVNKVRADLAKAGIDASLVKKEP
jgi:cell division protein FtsN